MLENGGRKTAALRSRAGSLHFPPAWIRLPSHTSNLCSGAEEQGLTVSTSELEAALEEKVKVEDYRRFFRPCIWMNLPFIRVRVLTEGVLAVSAVALTAE